jgi:hypothetical protein
MSIDIKSLVSNRLQLESYQLMKEVAQDQAGEHEGFYAWFQTTIAHAEATGKEARAMAAVIVMQAYAEELIDDLHEFDQERLQQRVLDGIQQMVAGK